MRSTKKLDMYIYIYVCVYVYMFEASKFID